MKVLGKFNARTEYPMLASVVEALGQPLTILDTETTGLGDPITIGIVEFGAITITPDGDGYERNSLINPQMDIPKGASDVHGITNERVSGAPLFSEISDFVLDAYKTHIISGFNQLGYDTPVIQARVNDTHGQGACPRGTHIDVRMIWTKGNKYGKGKLFEVAEHYGVEVKDAHAAIGDVRMTASIMESMIERHGAQYIVDQIAMQNKFSTMPRKPSTESRSSAPDAAGSDRRAGYGPANLMERLNKQGEHLPMSDIPKEAARMGVTVTSLMFSLSDWVRNDRIPVSSVTDHAMQSMIGSVLDESFQSVMAGQGEYLTKNKSPLLKPLLEQINRLVPNADYLQLHVALKNNPDLVERNTIMRKTELDTSAQQSQGVSP